ncbi:hypothetical protein [Neorhizobium sp. JUb45]|uniref:hypothetical protein n=1 Tax=unclassified Neorhizobium TaxID=2629175 RepID=UPI001052D4FB|nr:hypothetical protein [Neorhizobium sp. JUb45]
MVREIRNDRVQQALDSVAEKKSERLQGRGTRPASTNKKKSEKNRLDANAPDGNIVPSDDLEIGQNRVPSSALT